MTARRVVNAQIRPASLKRAMEFYEAKALETLTTSGAKCVDGGSVFESGSATSSKNWWPQRDSIELARYKCVIL